ncbi:MAG: ATP-binding protein [Treponema sp.]|jgi:predicted AAA+ superfamily ATPase|nr:ATP-binding protein [Treponema sp.]
MKQDGMIGAAECALADIAGLVLFSSIQDKPFMKTLRELLEQVCAKTYADAPSLRRLVQGWAACMAALPATVSPEGAGTLYDAVAGMTLRDDNRFTRAAEGAEPLSPLVAALARIDLSRLGRLAAFDLSGLGFHLAGLLREAQYDAAAQAIEEEARILWATEGKGSGSILDTLFPENTDWGASLTAFAEYIRRVGAGALGQYRSFRWADSALRPVLNPDPVRLSSLAGYEEQRGVVMANTLRLLEGKPANNLLLYGDRGTGKSATVKAVCNEYAQQGLRLLEVRKGDLVQLPAILETLRSRGLRFIIFIDDLSFERLDDSFTTLKMLLEGGIEARPSQAVIYATSNRRHLVKEHTADRPTSAVAADALLSGDMRAFDTMQEQFSLADRFGLTVVFTAPGQEEFLRIAEYIARQRGIVLDSFDTETGNTFRLNALRWERWFNGRSPRTAVQYVDWVAGGGGFPWE